MDPPPNSSLQSKRLDALVHVLQSSTEYFDLLRNGWTSRRSKYMYIKVVPQQSSAVNQMNKNTIYEVAWYSSSSPSTSHCSTPSHLNPRLYGNGGGLLFPRVVWYVHSTNCDTHLFSHLRLTDLGSHPRKTVASFPGLRAQLCMWQKLGMEAWEQH